MELELKFKVDKDYVPILTELGYTQGKLRHQSDTYFLNGEMVQGFKTWLRLRDNKLTQTYSLDCHQMKVVSMADETEIPLSSKEHFENMQMILETLGHPVQCVVNKKRRPFNRGDFEVVLDEIEGLGAFLEVELMADGTQENMTRLHAAAYELGLNPADAIDTGYPNLLVAAQKK